MTAGLKLVDTRRKGWGKQPKRWPFFRVTNARRHKDTFSAARCPRNSSSDYLKPAPWKEFYPQVCLLLEQVVLDCAALTDCKASWIIFDFPLGAAANRLEL